MTTAANPASPWLFPGQFADEHRSYRLVRVLQLGIPARSGRLAVWRELARQSLVGALGVLAGHSDTPRVPRRRRLARLRRSQARALRASARRTCRPLGHPPAPPPGPLVPPCLEDEPVQVGEFLRRAEKHGPVILGELCGTWPSRGPYSTAAVVVRRDAHQPLQACCPGTALRSQLSPYSLPGWTPQSWSPSAGSLTRRTQRVRRSARSSRIPRRCRSPPADRAR
jgi:hypothetical protein